MVKPCSFFYPPLLSFPTQPERESEADEEHMDKLRTQQGGVSRHVTVAYLTQVSQHLDFTEWIDIEAPIHTLLL